MSFRLIVIAAPVLAAFIVSAVQFAMEQTASRCLRLIGSVFLLVVVASHLAEKFQWLAWIGWGLPDSPGTTSILSAPFLARVSSPEDCCFLGLRRTEFRTASRGGSDGVLTASLSLPSCVDGPCDAREKDWMR